MAITCWTDLAVESIEWLDHEYNVLVNESRVQNLTLAVGRDEGDTEYMCRVTSPFGSQNKSVILSCPHTPVDKMTSTEVVAAAVASVLVILSTGVAGVILVIYIMKRYSCTLMNQCELTHACMVDLLH